jgi:hypothetical protein
MVCVAVSSARRDGVSVVVDTTAELLSVEGNVRFRARRSGPNIDENMSASPGAPIVVREFWKFVRLAKISEP